jgi:lipopolysaccharide/colanic/teichoic acid biosynthesis glycosyltransferase
MIGTGDEPAGASRQGGSPRIRVNTGFLPPNETFHRVYNLVLAIGLFLMVLPLFLVISAALLLTQGRSVFFFGPRLGRGKKLFHSIKFRTLDGEKAKELSKHGALPPGTGIETPLGGFLRDTRLDELPQLLNVIAGDMNICGPRPARPELAEVYSRTIPVYDARFAVKPGLVGPTQAYMNHATSRALRARYNALLVRMPVNYPRELMLMILVGSCVIARGATQTWRTLRAKLPLRATSGDVLRARQLSLTFRPEGAEESQPVAAASESTLWIDAPTAEAAAAARSGALIMRLPDGKLRVARVELEPLGRDGFGGAAAYGFQPSSDFAYHVISRYLLQKVVVPHKSHLPVSAALDFVSGWFGQRGQLAVARAS